MSDSSTSLELVAGPPGRCRTPPESPRRRAGRRFTAGPLWPAAIAAVALLASAVPSQALDPQRTMAQYLGDRWGVDRGFPGGSVSAITQTPDGYLWIATEKGLVRFDGLSFRLLDPQPRPAVVSPAVLGLAVADDGALLLRMRGPLLLRFDGRDFTPLVAGTGRSDTVISAMTATPDGTVLIAPLGDGVGVTSYAQGTFTRQVPSGTMASSFVMSIARAADNSLWLGTRDAGLVRYQNGALTRFVDELADPKVNSLLATPDGAVLIGTDQGVSRWSDGRLEADGLPGAGPPFPALGLLRDRDANIWIAAGPAGLIRANAGGVLRLDAGEATGGRNVTAVFEDREGVLWVGTSDGLERFRDGTFRTYATSEGLPPGSPGPVFVDADRRVWFGPSSGGLYWLRDGQVHAVIRPGDQSDVVYSIDGGGGEVWAGSRRSGLMRVQMSDAGPRVDRFTRSAGLPQESFFAVHRSRDGSVWAGTLSAGVVCYRDGRFTTLGRADGMASNTVTAIAEAADGAMWFATPSGVSIRDGDRWSALTAREGLPGNDVITLLEDAEGGMWIGTSAGLSYAKDRRVQPLPAVPPALETAILGLATDGIGGLWVSTAEAVFTVPVSRLLDGSLAESDLRAFGLADGLLSVEGIKRHRSLAADGDGRMWLSLTRGLSVAEPERLAGAPVALTHVESLWADGEPLSLAGDVRVPAGSHRISVAFTGLSLSVPERVAYRYRLDGFDAGWSPPGRAREAAYTNLAPGSYVFRVLASDSAGRWSDTEARLPFVVEPTFWEATWFRIAVVSIAALAVWGLYAARVRRLAGRLSLRFEERLAERTRIAQDLHDTLLQGLMSASMQLHVAADRVPEGSPAKPGLARVLVLMQQVIDEGRHAVTGLRSPARPGSDLEEALGRIPADLAIDAPPGFRVVVEGQPRELHPLIRDEVYRIGREAIVNALRHARARHIDAGVVYLPSGLRLLVRDDGTGIDDQTMKTGRDGHWGLSGMRERARAIGGVLTLWSRPGHGTDVELMVPGAVAFRRVTPSVRRGLRDRFRRR